MGRAMEVDISKDSSEFFDKDYEFNAPKFFDFTAQEELPWQAEEAQRWFMHVHAGYSPSPLIIKLKWRTNEVVYGEPSTCKSMGSQHDDSNVCVNSNNTTQGNEPEKPQLKSQLRPYISESSTLLKPTASHLAKMNQLGVSSPTSNRRAHNPASLSNRSTDASATKRQKLENGNFKERVSQLRYQSSFAHKSSKTLGSAPSPPKVTVPKGPCLETSRRARRFMSVRVTCQGDTKTAKQKARLLSKKIFEGHFSAQTKKSATCSPHLQDHLSNKPSPPSPKPPNFSNSSKDIARRFKSQLANSKGLKLSGDKKCSHDPPTELFDKMSLKADVQPTRKPKAISAFC